jgi:phage head maturation protease
MADLKFTKTYTKDEIDVELQEGSREIIATVSTDRIDGDGEIVLPKGVDFSRFRKNAVVYFNHDYKALPIGRALWIRAKDREIISKYQITDKTQLAREVFGLLQDGVIRAHSIGFESHMPSAPSVQELRFHPEWKGARAIHRKTLLLEFSVVGIPCNEDALAIAVSKGYSSETLDILSGRTQAQAEATQEIIDSVSSQEPQKRKASEILKMVLKELEKSRANVNKDKIIADVLPRLTRYVSNG